MFFFSVTNHLLFFVDIGEYTRRSLVNLSFGLSYDVMTSCQLVLIPMVFACISYKMSQGINLLIASLFSWISLLDYNYFLNFRTHMPFRSIEYFRDINSFQSSSVSIFQDPLTYYFLASWVVGIAIILKSPTQK